uniref:Calmodulin n=1 Tax=Trepomonas sp. PC1 TaxID=1076344 RepID=A0A146K658_9EUKA|eukprot:JAP92323.1 Calmodulin [Trepomonas sp. PC1]
MFQITNTFKAMDTDGSGKIELPEFIKQFEEEGFNNKDGVLDIVFAIMDMDGNGYLDKNEFSKLFLFIDQNYSENMEFSEMLSKVADLDGNGIISFDELTQFCKSLNIPIPKNIVKQVGDGVPVSQFNTFLKQVLQMKKKK